jgi:hypothetical protein
MEHRNVIYDADCTITLSISGKILMTFRSYYFGAQCHLLFLKLVLLRFIPKKIGMPAPIRAINLVLWQGKTGIVAENYQN